MKLRLTAIALGSLAFGCSDVEPPPAPLLRVGESIEQPLSDGESHDFTLVLDAGSLLRARAVQKQVDLTLTLIDPEGATAAFSDSYNGRDGPEWLLHQTDESGKYVLRVQGIDGVGRFDLDIESAASPTAEDRHLLRALEILAANGPMKKLEGLLAIARTLPGLIQARLHLLKGTLLRDGGQPLESLRHLEVAVEGFARHGNAFELAPALNVLGHLQTVQGHGDAESTLLKALETAARVDQWPATRVAWNNLGILHANRGDHSAALDAYGHAQEVQKLLDDPEGIADSLHNVGLELIFLGRFAEGNASLRRAVQARQELGDRLGEARSLASLGWGLGAESLAGGTESTACLDTFEQAVQALKTLGAQQDLAIALEQRGRLRHRWGDLAGARRDLEQALDLLSLDRSDRLHAAWLHLGLGVVWRGKGDFEKSRWELRHAVSEFDALDYGGGQTTARAELARTLRVSGDRKAAAEVLLGAVRTIEKSRSGLRIAAFRSTFLSGRQEIYRQLVDLWAEAAWQEPQEAELAYRALAAAERGKARSLLDQLASDKRSQVPHLEQRQDRLRQILSALETEQVFHRPADDDGPSPDDSTAKGHPVAFEAIREARFAWLQARERAARQTDSPASVNPLDASAISSLLDAETTLVALSLGQERSWLFLVTDSSVRVFPLAPRSQLESAAGRAYELLPLEKTRGYVTAARLAKRRLADLLFETVWDQLERKRLVFVPDGTLHRIPLGLLTDPNGTLLLKRFEIVHLPSASVLAHLRRRRSSRQPPPRLMALVADPVFSPFDPRLEQALEPRAPGTRHHYLHRLPATGEEAEHVAALARAHFGSEVPIFRAFEAKRELLTEGDLSEFRLLHFATHGFVDDDDPALAGLVFSLYHPDGTPRHGILPARDLFELKVRADLVVLSACRTAIGRPIHGEGLVGLSHGFLVAGTSSLVVSLWDVDDRATTELMRKFYRNLFDQGIGPARALRRAQLDLHAQGIWSPAQWGAFIAVGDWNVPIN